MTLRVWFLVLPAISAVAILRAAPETTAPTALAVNQEKAVPFATALPREKSTPRAQHKIWSGLVFASNVPDPKAAPEELREFAPRLKRVFGYNQFQMAGSAANAIDADGESWLVPSKNFWLSVKARRATSKEARGGYLLNVQLFHDQRPLVDTEAKLAPGSPLFIRGPACGKGQLIVVLQVQK